MMEVWSRRIREERVSFGSLVATPSIIVVVILQDATAAVFGKMSFLDHLILTIFKFEVSANWRLCNVKVRWI